MHCLIMKDIFIIRVLKDGSYSVFVNASNGYADTTITNLVVSKTIRLDYPQKIIYSINPSIMQIPTTLLSGFCILRYAK
jgi:hypothetical protein